MTDTTQGGNTPDSPTGDAVDQGVSNSDAQAAGAEHQTDSGQGQPADSQAADTGEVKGEGGKTDTTLPDKETLPFDQHPKWQSARQAEKRVNEILEKHGYASIDDLETAAQQRQSLESLIGGRDANELVNEYEYLKNQTAEFEKVKAYWAEQEALKQESEEEPYETIARLKREKQELARMRDQEVADREALRDNQRILSEFDNGIRTAVSSTQGLSEAERELMVEFFGVDNPMASVDVTNQAEVRNLINSGSKRFSDLLSKIKQEAVDSYAAGKGDVTPISPADTGADTSTVASEPELLSKGRTREEFERLAKERLHDRLTKAINAP